MSRQTQVCQHLSLRTKLSLKRRKCLLREGVVLLSSTAQQDIIKVAKSDKRGTRSAELRDNLSKRMRKIIKRIEERNKPRLKFVSVLLSADTAEKNRVRRKKYISHFLCDASPYRIRLWRGKFRAFLKILSRCKVLPAGTSLRSLPADILSYLGTRKPTVTRYTRVEPVVAKKNYSTLPFITGDYTMPPIAKQNRIEPPLTNSPSYNFHATKQNTNKFVPNKSNYTKPPTTNSTPDNSQTPKQNTDKLVPYKPNYIKPTATNQLSDNSQANKQNNTKFVPYKSNSVKPPATNSTPDKSPVAKQNTAAALEIKQDRVESMTSKQNYSKSTATNPNRAPSPVVKQEHAKFSAIKQNSVEATKQSTVESAIEQLANNETVQKRRNRRGSSGGKNSKKRETAGNENTISVRSDNLPTKTP